ncbi:MAG: FecR domain-containing protein, partial [Candidatus Rokuibacteriota bacterium]
MLACALGSAAVVLWSLLPSPSQAALLESVEGEVYLVTPKGRVRAQAGVEILSGQGVDTLGPRSRARLTYDDGTQVDLAADSRLRLSPGLPGHGLYLEHGGLTAGVESQPLVLTTPQADLRAVGARFAVTARPTWTRLETVQGRVRLTRLKDGASVEASAGQVAEAEPGVALVARPIAHDRKVPRTGLELWLSADQGVTLEGTGVSRWADQSGRGRHATQDVTAFRPRLIKSAIGGKPALQFGDEKFMRVPPGFGDFSAGLSVFLVVRPFDHHATYLCLNTSSKEASDGIAFASNRIEFAYQNAVVRPPRPGASAPQGYFFGVYQSLAVVHAPSAVVTMYRNGVPQSTGTCSLPDKVERASNTVGGRRPDTLEGDLAEVLVYSRALSEAERQDVERY